MTHKEIKDAYKQIKHPAGVFQIRNIGNGKVFISSSQSLHTIWNSQKYQLQTGNHQNPLLQKDWNESGADQFVFEVLGEVEHSDRPGFDLRREIKTLEQMFLEDIQPYDEKGYHMRKSGGA